MKRSLSVSMTAQLMATLLLATAFLAFAQTAQTTKTIRIDVDREKTGAEPTRFLPIVGNWIVAKLLQVLFGGIVDKNIHLSELFYRLRDSLSAKLFLADIAFDQQAFAPVFFHQTLGFSRIPLFFQVNN